METGMAGESAGPTPDPDATLCRAGARRFSL